GVGRRGRREGNLRDRGMAQAQAVRRGLGHHLGPRADIRAAPRLRLNRSRRRRGAYRWIAIENSALDGFKLTKGISNYWDGAELNGVQETLRKMSAEAGTGGTYEMLLMDLVRYRILDDWWSTVMGD